ncbi:hypothetical protein ACVNF4_01005 [Streptomyces sp. S6]
MAQQTQQVHHEFRLPLFVEPEKLRWVRRGVGTRVRAWGLDAVVDDALEVVTELRITAWWRAEATGEAAS